MKKMGATSILLILTLAVFSILAVSRRPLKLFKVYPKFQQETDASLAKPLILEKKAASKHSPVYTANPLVPICGYLNWSGLPEDRCDLRPITLGFSECMTHRRIVEIDCMFLMADTGSK